MAFTVPIFPGSNCFKVASIPFFNVIVDEGHPLHAPCNKTFTSLVSGAYDKN